MYCKSLDSQTGGGAKYPTNLLERKVLVNILEELFNDVLSLFGINNTSAPASPVPTTAAIAAGANAGQTGSVIDPNSLAIKVAQTGSASVINDLANDIGMASKVAGAGVGIAGALGLTGGSAGAVVGASGAATTAAASAGAVTATGTSVTATGATVAAGSIATTAVVAAAAAVAIAATAYGIYTAVTYNPDGTFRDAQGRELPLIIVDNDADMTVARGKQDAAKASGKPIPIIKGSTKYNAAHLVAFDDLKNPDNRAVALGVWGTPSTSSPQPTVLPPTPPPPPPITKPPGKVIPRDRL